MASLKTQQKDLSLKIDALKLISQSFLDEKDLNKSASQSPYTNKDALKKRVLGEGPGQSVNTDFIGDLINTLIQSTGGGPDEVKSFLKKIISKVEKTAPRVTKIIIEELLRAVNCEEDFLLPLDPITFKASEIDFFDILKSNPNTLPGRAFYEKQSINQTFYPLPVNKLLYESTVNTTSTTFTSVNGLDLYDIEFDQFNQEYTLTFKPNLSIGDFLSHYYSSFELFNTKDVLADVIDLLYGILSVDVSTKRVKSFGELSKICQAIASLCSNPFEGDSLLKEGLFNRGTSQLDGVPSYEFDDEDTRYVEDYFNLKINKLYRLENCNNFETEINSDLAINAILDLEIFDAGDVMESFLSNASNGVPPESGFDVPTINLNLNTDIFKQIPTIILSKVMGPKSLIPYVAITTAIDNAKDRSLDVVSYVKNNDRFITRVGKRIYDDYKEELYTEIKKRLSDLIGKIIKEIATQQLNARLMIILSLINAIKKLLDSDLSTCAGIIRALLSLLNFKTGLPFNIPMPLLYGAYAREGMNSTRAFTNTIQELENIGYNTGALPDGSPNKHVLGMSAQLKGLMKEIGENGKIQFVSLPATGAGPTGPVVTPMVQGSGIIMSS